MCKLGARLELHNISSPKSNFLPCISVSHEAQKVGHNYPHFCNAPPFLSLCSVEALAEAGGLVEDQVRSENLLLLFLKIFFVVAPSTSMTKFQLHLIFGGGDKSDQSKKTDIYSCHVK